MSFQAADAPTTDRTSVPGPDRFQPRPGQLSQDAVQAQGPARGIAIAVLISLPFWALVALAIFLLR